MTALDVTSTVTPVELRGHRPDAAVGDAARRRRRRQATSKPGVRTSSIGGVETFVVVAGTGINSADPSKGKIVAGYNLETGALLWQFEIACPLTSDITIFETDDTRRATEARTIDGYADRAVFADDCGYVYKINPAQDLSGGYMDNSGIRLRSRSARRTACNRYALFSTQTTAGAIGGQRPIAGTIGARADSTTDMVLFFGTGGLESYDATQTNEFYAVYLEERDRSGTRSPARCTGSPLRCEKFYGGVVVTPDTVIVSRSRDAVIGGTNNCDYGTTHVEGYNLNTPGVDVRRVAGRR